MSKFEVGKTYKNKSFPRDEPATCVFAGNQCGLLRGVKTGFEFSVSHVACDVTFIEHVEPVKKVIYLHLCRYYDSGAEIVDCHDRPFKQKDFKYRQLLGVTRVEVVEGHFDE